MFRATVAAIAVVLVLTFSAVAKEVQVSVELKKVYCGNTEDVTGADHFYVVTALTGGTQGSAQSSITKPIKINDGQTKEFRSSERVVFNAKVPAAGQVVGGMKAYDEDFAKDWKDQAAAAKEATNALAAGSASLGPKGATAATVLKIAFTVFDKLAALDRDDRLGTVLINIPANGPAVETKTWTMVEKGLGFSTWKYKVTYRIVRKK